MSCMPILCPGLPGPSWLMIADAGGWGRVPVGGGGWLWAWSSAFSTGGVLLVCLLWDDGMDWDGLGWADRSCSPCLVSVAHLVISALRGGGFWYERKIGGSY